MPKPVQKLKFGLLVGAILLAGCEDSREQNAPLKSAKQPTISLIAYDNALEYLNAYRNGSQLKSLKFNDDLALGAKNHARYCTANEYMGHDETRGGKNFTGANPAERAKFAGYQAASVFENIAYKEDFTSAIDGLFTAIYHRFAFLSPSVDEVGYFMAKDEKFSSFVFLMGNSKIENFCKKGLSDGGSGKFYTRVCANEDLKMRADRLESLTYSSRPYVKFPEGMPVLPYFSGESPDPFPECKITANPVSIEFNQNFKNIKMLNFEIYKDGEQLDDLKILDAKNDINKKFSSQQFAAFSREVFDFDAQYQVVFSYERDGVRQDDIKWSFKTKGFSHPYFEAVGGDVLGVDADKIYEIFFRPKNCNDVIKRYDYKYPKSLSPDIKQSGTNTLSVNLSGLKGDSLEILLNNATLVKVVLTSSSQKALEKRRGYLIKGALIALAAIFAFTLIWLNFKRSK
ncbi:MULTISPECIES: CAP domain-containing protein [Campylobacter]|uniref:CAP domain-containing protein n=1 Tax=Campylobacter TaxID=194 RepID=UPI00027A354F|nr:MULTISPECIES: CAP domain-containing protein [Campylobacter]EJP75535.1 cysteine-rich secretory family protein [Campylobacter sp. FOBRC14]